MRRCGQAPRRRTCPTGGSREAPSPRQALGRRARNGQRLGITCILDVGAHVGQYAFLLRAEAGFTGHIASFEPCASSYQRLVKARRGDFRWSGHPYALGSVTGSEELNVFAAATNLNSFLPPSRYGSQRFPEIAIGPHRERVPVHRLAEVFDEVTADVRDRRVLLKLDTQGFDLEVLKGAREILDQIVAVQVELSSIPIYQWMPSLTTTLTYLERAGYLPTGMFPVTCDRDGLRVIEFDCVCVNAVGGTPS